MTETTSSTLNPSADIFIPGKNSNLKNSRHYDENGMKQIYVPFWTISKTKNIKKNPTGQMREIAKQLAIDYLAEKKKRGEETITKREIIKILERVLLTSSCKVNLKIPIETRLMTFPELGKLKDVETENEAINYTVEKQFTFDLSVFKPPKPSTFLSSLYGLYRHEQAVRPLLSLTLPPSIIENTLWSLISKDLSLWNPYCDEPCSCPPMFGYSLPPRVFGNLFNLDYKCSKEGIHFCRYPPSANGNESALFNTKPDYSVEAEVLEDYIEDESEEKSTLEFYSEQLKTIVSEVCNLILDEDAEEPKPSLIEDYKVYENYKDMYWDTDPSKFVLSDAILEDDNFHPLLEMDYSEPDEGVSAEIEEMIRRCLSPDHKMDNSTESQGTMCCNPPCSFWCKERSDSVSSSSSVSANIGLLTDTTDFLLNASTGCIPSTGEKDIGSHFHKRFFKRSFSANDCDLSCEERYKINYEMPQISTSSREDLEFLRSDPINFFKSLRKNDSWKDNDSGIITHWSSREEIDIYSDMRDGSYDQDHAPMWSLLIQKTVFGNLCLNVPNKISILNLCPKESEI